MLDAETFPRYAIFNGKRGRVIEYCGDGWFRIEVMDMIYRLHRNQFTFIKEASK